MTPSAARQAERVLDQRGGDGLADEIIHRHLHALRFELLVQPDAQVAQLFHVDVDRDVEVRELLLGTLQRRRDRAAHLGDRDDVRR